MTAHHLPGHDTPVNTTPGDTGVDRGERRATDRVVAVVGDTATATRVHRYAALIEDLAGVPCQVILLDDPDPSPAELGQLLPFDTGAVILTGTRTPLVGDAASPLPVLAGRDIVAIAVTAALLTTLSRRGRAPRDSRVVIAGADTLPILCRLLVTAGVGDITTWRTKDAVAFPLHRVAEGVDAVIDLLGVWPTDQNEYAMLGSGPAVITPDAERDPLLALPGLLRAIIQAPEAAPEIALNVEVHLACALALVMATPSDHQLPQVPDHGLTDRVAEAATQALRTPVPHPRTPRSGRPTR
jgi:hypothetical protein